jgi:sigma-B regulation protein RsbU (phosphoserine phosphatase)
LYLIDVTGHGLDSALLAVTATNMIRSGTLPSVDMRRPEQVIAALNDAFPSEQHGGKYFTIWYGVFEPRTSRLTWSGAGHHPAVLQGMGAPEPVLLPSSGPLIGCAPGLEFPAETCPVPASSRLLIFSDGVFELLRDDRIVWDLAGAIEFLSKQAARGESVLDALLAHVYQLRGCTRLEDDFSIIEALFP